MFRVSRWLGTTAGEAPPPPPLPFSLYGTIEGQLLDQKRQKMTPLDDYLVQRIEKHNLLDLF